MIAAGIALRVQTLSQAAKVHQSTLVNAAADFLRLVARREGEDRFW